MALSDPLRVSDGFFSTIGGVNSGIDPADLVSGQLAWAVNARNRGGKPKPRPGLTQHKLTGYTNATHLNFQGMGFYRDSAGKGTFIVALSGRLFLFRIKANETDIQEITIPGDPQNLNAQVMFFCQAGGSQRYMVIQDGVTPPVIYDGAKCRRAGSQEIPIGSGPMAYGNGRLWLAFGNQFGAGDIDGGPTGVLGWTENTYISEGGLFNIPLEAGRISSMKFVPTLNTALGQGELLVCTPDSVFTVSVPTERGLWKDLVDPIQRVTVINNGANSDASTQLINSDVFMSSLDGIRSVIQAVRDFGSPGNVPISRELNRVIDGQDQSLLKFCSAVVFKNRLLMAIQPQPRHNGAWFRSIAVMDFDPISSQGQKSPAVWDGIWSDYEFLWLSGGKFNRVERAFGVTQNRNKGFIKSVLVTTGDTQLLIQPATVSAPDAGGTQARVHGLYRTYDNAPPAVVTPGTGYVVGEVVTLNGPTPKFFDASFIILTVNGSGGMTSIQQVAGRQGLYCNPPLSVGGYPVTGGSGTGGVIQTAAIMDRATVEGFRVRTATVDPAHTGTGYVANEVVTLTGPTGLVMASFKVLTVSSGNVVTMELIQGGHYNNPPFGAITTTSNLSGTGLRIIPAYLELSGEPINSGSGYSSPPTIAFTRATATPSVAVVVPFMGFEWEFWEISDENKFDRYRDINGNLIERRIKWSLESPSFKFMSNTSSRRDQKMLMGAELAIHRITGLVDFTIKYRPDQFPAYQDWHAFQYCALYKDCAPLVDCAPPKVYQEQNRPRVGVPRPPDAFDDSGKVRLDLGREFQVKLNIEGYCEIKMLEVVAHRVVEPNNPECAPAVGECVGLVVPCEIT